GLGPGPADVLASIRTAIGADPYVGVYKLVAGAPSSLGDVFWVAVLGVTPAGDGLPYSQVLAPVSTIGVGSLGAIGLTLVGADYCDASDDPIAVANAASIAAPGLGAMAGGA